MFFNEKFTEELKQKNNIVDVVGRYCNLKKRGGSHWACCPLPGHSERTPSFTVNEAGQFFKCFGCGRGGDVITFVMTMENLDYVGAVKLLAEQAGMPLPDDDRDSERVRKDKSDRERLLSVMKTAALYYVHNLFTPAAKPHRDYLAERGIDSATVAAFGLGASTDYDSLPAHLRSKGFTDEEMIRCGVCQKSGKGNGVFDAQYGRLIIPIINNLGNVIAFGGRLLEKKPNFAKYKNTQETELFVKNRTLYNINNLKKERAKGNLTEIIMVEGYMDTISVYGAGFRNVVASMGTSLTVEQARMLKRYANTVLISYDGDGAGQKATIRGLEILSGEGLEVKVVRLPDGLDPDDVIKQRGADAYRQLLSESIPLVDFKLYNLSKEYDLDDLSDKRRYIAEAIKVISACKTDSEKEDLLRRLGKRTNTTFESLKRDADRLSSGEKSGEKRRPDAGKPMADGIKNAERFVLCAMLFNKRYTYDFDFMEVDFSSDPVHRKIADLVIDGREAGREIFPAAISSLFNEDELDEYNYVLSAGDNVFGTPAEEKFYKDCVSALISDRASRDLGALNALFAAETDTEKRQQLAALIAKLTVKAKK